MSASSSITRTEIFPLRMPRSTVLGTGDVFVVPMSPVPGRTAAWRAGKPPSVRLGSNRPMVAPIYPAHLRSCIPPWRSRPRVPSSPNSGLLPWSPPSGRPGPRGCSPLSLQRPWWRSDGATTALSGCRGVAQVEFLVAPGPDVVLSRHARRDAVGDTRASGGTKWRDAGDRVSLRMPPRSKDHT